MTEMFDSDSVHDNLNFIKHRILKTPYGTHPGAAF